MTSELEFTQKFNSLSIHLYNLFTVLYYKHRKTVQRIILQDKNYNYYQNFEFGETFLQNFHAFH